MREHIIPLGCTILLLCSFRSAIADWNVVPTGSMQPNIVEGDRIFVNKLAYGLKVPFTTWHIAHWSEPTAGEIVVFASPTDGTRLVKRVIGVPGDTVQLINDRLIINGSVVSYGAAQSNGKQLLVTETIGSNAHPLLITPMLPAMRNFGPVTVPADQFFVLGDNRDNSADSRYIGFVPRDNIVGRSASVVISLDPDSHLPRWKRTFKTLP
jgi:signal peptidase I